LYDFLDNCIEPSILVTSCENHVDNYAENESPADMQSEEENSNNDLENDNLEEINPTRLTEDFAEANYSKRDKSKIMFKESGITVDSVTCMVAGYSAVGLFGLSNNARKSLINLLKFCAGPNFTYLNISNYYFDKTFDPPNDKILFHYYCTDCYCEIYVLRKNS